LGWVTRVSRGAVGNAQSYPIPTFSPALLETGPFFFQQEGSALFELLFFSIGVLFLLGSVDDLLIDIAHFFHGIKPIKISPLQWAVWRAQAEKPIAIMIPAWQESSVLRAMVRTNLARIQYHNYRWFIGVYPNDSETLEIARALSQEYPDKVVMVITDRPGPTSKAHCLNCIMRVIQGMVKIAKKEGGGWIPHYVAIHDAEDVIHPDAFTVINGQPDDLDFIQVPIFSLPVPASDWVSGTYLDEFAEIHLKEVPVRKVLKMPIPSAGVGTFFSLDLLFKMGERFHYWFDEENLTEDYEISLRIARLGGKQDFLLYLDEENQMIATREYFPHELGRSIRQKTRWTTGIGLQTMSKWRGYGSFANARHSYRDLVTAYAIARDRKALWANPSVMFAWFVMTLFLLSVFMHAKGGVSGWKHPSWILTLLTANFILFGFRMFQRARFCAQIYGKAHGVLAIPRVALSTYINGVACIRALLQYFGAAKTQQQGKIAWDKTDHRFPDLLPPEEKKVGGIHS
jgi:adsorption protein B